jgi:Uma2 family endonuclease
MANVPHEQVRIRIQNSVGLPGLESVPQPDVVWAVQKSYRRRRPQAEDLFLVIEVADSSLRSDMGDKATLYAEAGVADYWVVDVFGRRVAVFREPQAGSYPPPTIIEHGGVISPLRFPAIELMVAELFPEDE